MKWRSSFLCGFRDRERRRHRARVLELNHFVDAARQEEDELEVLPAVHPGFNVGEEPGVID